MTNHWIDIKNADVVLIIGSNAAEHHPVSFKWIMRAKDNGAALIHVDPKFSRTSARCDYHVPLRSGTDIAFLGGMVNYILESNSYFHDYVVNYTNASFIVGKGYDFKDGLFSGYDAKARKYDQSKWGFEKGPDGAPLRDATLKHERCVFNLMKKHYSRYTLKNVSDITGVSEENLLKVYKQFCATGKPDKAGTILYALGWTQHTVGVQNIRCSTLVQLLMAFRLPTEGKIYFDGRDAATLSRRTIRHNISCVLQRAGIYSGTIRENIAMGRPGASEEELMEAAAVAQMADYIKAQPEGLDHRLEQAGKNLSGGQKQRVSIARAVLKNAPIYLFDDSFSALDFMTEANLRRALAEKAAGRTQIVVTQRVTSAMSSDQIFVMDGGRLVDSGTHRELLERCKVYREIYLSQTGGERR